MAGARALICGLAGTELTARERRFLGDRRPWGVILFARNVADPPQVRQLTGQIRRALDNQHAPILIDQEGGRIQRIGEPHLRAYPSAATFGAIYRHDPMSGVEAAHLAGRLIGLDLIDLGIDVDCAPVLDIPAPESDPVISDRAYGTDADSVTTLGAAMADGLMSAGVLPVMKHVPGHGRATVDSHEALPVVDAPLDALDAGDFVPFRLCAPRMPLAMTAHVVFSAIDPEAPATLSRSVIDKIVRGNIRFDGALMTDDICMGALSDDAPAARARRAIRAGCDLVLHCNGDLDEAIKVAKQVPELAGDALRRTDAALAARRTPDPVDRRALEARLQDLVRQGEAA